MAKLGEHKQSVIVNSLYTAARLYEESAKTSRDCIDSEAKRPGLESIAAQFDKQAKEARDLAEEIEQSGLVCQSLADFRRHIEHDGMTLEAAYARLGG